jgi:hypothetical protein
MGGGVKRVLLALLVLCFPACSHFSLEDCEALGVREPRIRSSHWRMVLADPPAAAARFVPYAAMSALAYAEDADCGTADRKLEDHERRSLEQLLSDRGWHEVRQAGGSNWIDACEHDSGLFYRVWVRETGPRKEVAMAFRGTWGMKDWLNGNLHWLTRFLPLKDQYEVAREHAARVLAHFSPEGTAPGSVRLYTAGHSLGGGLAQHILYTHPDKVLQAFAFNPSSVTGYVEQTPANQIAGCRCDQPELDGEARIYRIYDSYEILANLRIFHKLFFDPERHIHEVRFENKQDHSMKELAFFLLEQAGNSKAANPAVPWYAGRGKVEGTGQSCTEAFIQAQRTSCSAPLASERFWDRCPQ